MNKANYILETFDITKKYKETVAVDKVNMHIEEGDIYGFVGENGAGKTTIIRLVTGLSLPNSGEYSLFGVKSTDKAIDDAKRKISGIVESVTINRSMTALENLKLQCMITSSTKTDEELIALISKVGLNYEEIKNKKASNFSLGMRQRLGLAVAMVSDPKFILLDEPMNGLDPQGFVDVREIILKLHEEGVTFLISSHILSELDKICNKIGFISHGKLLEEISIEELHNKSRKKTVIVTKEQDKLLDLLKNKLSLSDFETEGYKISIYDNIDINDLINLISENKININSFNVLEDTIEDYYINLVMRGSHE